MVDDKVVQENLKLFERCIEGHCYFLGVKTIEVWEEENLSLGISNISRLGDRILILISS